MYKKPEVLQVKYEKWYIYEWMPLKMITENCSDG
jgi:hypothetical protein